MALELLHLRTIFFLFLASAMTMLSSQKACLADMILIGNSAGEVFGRDEFDLATHIPSSYVNFGPSEPISALASGIEGDVAIGINAVGTNAYVRKYNALSTGITSLATGNPVSALTTRPETGDIVIGDTGNRVFVRNRTNLSQLAPGYSGSDGLDFGDDITAVAALSGGDLIIGTAAGRLYARSGMNLAVTAAGAAVDNVNYAIPITAIAPLPGNKFATALSNGWVDVRHVSDISAVLTGVTWGIRVNALAGLPNGDVAVGLQNGEVHIRHSTDLIYGNVTWAQFTGGPAITALAATSNGNLIIGTANNLVFIRRGNDLYQRPVGYSGTDGLNFNAPIRAVAASGTGGAPSVAWRDISRRSVLQNDVIEARFQSGIIYQLIDRTVGRNLLYIDPTLLPSLQPVFGTSGIDLDNCSVTVESTATNVTSTFTAPGGATWHLNWTIASGAGDLILNTWATTPQPVEEMRVLLFGCNIVDHKLVYVNGYGQGEVYQAPWTGTLLGDPQTGGSPMTFIHPLVALFQGQNSGWFLEGRENLIGPACVMVRGTGQAANMGMVRRFPLTTSAPQMYEIRMRVYSGQWQNAVDPYLDWMQNTVGFVPVDQKSPVWVKRIKNQAYISVGDFEGLDMLAARVDPAKTFVGRQAEYRYYAFDIGYPDYRVNSTARQWFTYARQLGFHVGAHFNTYCIDKVLFPELVEQFKPGLMQIGTDGNGNPIYDGFGQNVYCSPAYQPWRQYLIQQMADAVSAGVDVIYLDQSMAPCGKFVVNGVTGVEGVMLLEQEIRQAYPTVAIETEQFNLMASRHAAFALSQMTLGHPLSGYIFNRFIRVVPEGIMYSPSDTATMDAFDTWGFMLPGADARREESWVQIARAFQDYNLAPDSRLPLGQYQLFGYQGANGVTAFFEKHATERGLLVYEPGKDPKWVGKRHFGITSWPGPGVPTFWEYGQSMRDWLIYNGSTALGLDPQQTYYMDESLSFAQNRFHITSVPSDFLPYSNAGKRIVSQETGDDDTYFKVSFSGHGQLTMYVPDNYDVYLDGQKVAVNRETGSAAVVVSASTTNPSVIRAIKHSEFELVGRFVYFPMQTPDQVRGWVAGDDAGGYITAVAGVGIFIGKLPQTTNIRLRGQYGMRPDSTTDFIGGEGVIRINGTEVVRISPGSPPWQMYSFDIDISAFAGEYVMIEMVCDGQPHGYAYAQWSLPEILADPTTSGTSPLGGAGPGNGWSELSAMAVTASSQHVMYPAQNLVNGSGISTDGFLHGNTGLFLTGQMAQSKANPHPGTVPGGHWVQFQFDKVYALGQMWIWNYNSKSGTYDWRIQGMKYVTIQYSVTGGPSPSEWNTIYSGEVPIAWSGSPDYKCLPSLKIDFRGAAARYVVITTADSPEHNRTGGAYSDAGLSEVRFYCYPGEPVSISTARQADDGTPVVLAGVTVAAKLRDSTGPIGFGVEQQDRSCGIRVVSTASVNPGDNVTLLGTIATIDGELVIDATSGSVVVNSSGHPIPMPLGMSNLASGGGPLFRQPGTMDDTTTRRQTAGLASIGLLVRIFGKVTARVSTGDWDGFFYIEDGSGLNDGSGYIGIRCRPFGGGTLPNTLPPLGAYVAATGIMGVRQIAGQNVRFLWTTDVTVLD